MPDLRNNGNSEQSHGSDQTKVFMSQIVCLQNDSGCLDEIHPMHYEKWAVYNATLAWTMMFLRNTDELTPLPVYWVHLPKTNAV